MGLSGGKHSNGKLSWKWAGNVKMVLHDRLCVSLWGDWHMPVPRADFDTDSTRRLGITASRVGLDVGIEEVEARIFLGTSGFQSCMTPLT